MLFNQFFPYLLSETNQVPILITFPDPSLHLILNAG
jgi:hypothetical protein